MFKSLKKLKYNLSNNSFFVFFPISDFSITKDKNSNKLVKESYLKNK